MRGSLMRGLLLLLAALACAPAWADYKDDYQDGVEAAEKGDWATVQRLMQSAIRENAEPNRRMRIYGTRFIEYIPHYYLGLALMNQGNCQAALSAFNNAANRQTVGQLSDFSSKQSAHISRCENEVRLAQADPPPRPVEPPPKPVEPTPPPPKPTPPPPKPTPTAKLAAADVQRASTALANAQRSASRIESSLTSAPLAGTGDARALSGELDASKRQLSSAETQLANARRQDSPSQLSQARNTIDQAASALNILNDRVESAKRGLAAQARAQALELAKRRGRMVIDELAALTSEAQAAGSGTTAALAGLAQRRQALETAIGGTDTGAIDSAIGALNQARRVVEQAIAAAPQPAPAELRRYVGLYLSGDYASVASWANPEALPKAKDQAQGLLLRAAARLHQYVRSGEMDNTLGAAIGADLRRAKTLDRSLKPNPKAFPPRLIALFEEA